MNAARAARHGVERVAGERCEFGHLPNFHVHEWTGCRVRRFTCGSISIVLSRHERKTEPPRQHDRVHVHFDQGEVLADARARPEAERQIGETVARRSGLRQESVGIEAIAHPASIAGCRCTRYGDTSTSVFAGSSKPPMRERAIERRVRSQPGGYRRSVSSSARRVQG